jgi:hypothetical protein
LDCIACLPKKCDILGTNARDPRSVPEKKGQGTKKMSGDTTDPARKKQRSARQMMKEPSPAVAREIDENLKRVYSATLSEDVPDRFAQLLAQLREKEKKT